MRSLFPRGRTTRLALTGGLVLGLSGCVVAPGPYDNGYGEAPVYVPWGAPQPYYGGGYYGGQSYYGGQGYYGGQRYQGGQQYQHNQPPPQGGPRGGGVVQQPPAHSGPPQGGQGGAMRRGQNERPNVGGPDGGPSR